VGKVGGWVDGCVCVCVCITYLEDMSTPEAELPSPYNQAKVQTSVPVCVCV
jgi:hypothetical protein